MAYKRPKPEEIVTQLRRVEALTGQGMPRLDAIRYQGCRDAARNPARKSTAASRQQPAQS